MELYILRHAVAIPHGTLGYPNDDRPLTEDGINRMEKAARGLAEIIPHLDVILTSPLKRAHQTASIVGRALRCEQKIKVSRQLLPGSPIKEMYGIVTKFVGKERLMIVGHEPDLSRFASSLLGSEIPIIEFKKGALCRMDVDPSPVPGKQGRLIWHLSSKHLRALARK
jgi:phosphohistidine phosphatase